jgi:thiamine biosynthesis protein ThiI
MLIRYASKIAEIEEASAIIMGDSLGQVASQTLKNINTIDQATTFPILRPLIGLDKTDIMDIARKIGTYEISILPSGGCSAVPTRPATRSKIKEIAGEENKIDIDKMIMDLLKRSKKEFL